MLILETHRRSAPRILEALAGRGLLGRLTADLDQAVDKLDNRSWRLLVADAEDLSPDPESALRRIRGRRPEMPVVILDARATVDRAVALTRLGAAEYLPQPLGPEQIDKILKHLPPEAGDDAAKALVGSSQALRDAMATAEKVATTTLPVLITGESGTGKELLSQFIHSRSRRSDGPFVRVNCAAVSETLLESELFGHEQGAFTGAMRQRKGCFERADRGTLLLDEITETTPRLQAQLLRVLEGQELQRVGGSRTLQVDVRILATTNRDLQREVRSGNFRGDLYYRLAGICLQMPALRRRREDLEALIEHFVDLYAHETGRDIERIDPEMIAVLGQCPLPGNVRQLRNIVRTALALGRGPVLSLHEEAQTAGDLHQVRLAPAHSDTLKLQELERRAILEALRRTKSHQAKAADLLGITDRTLREKLRRYRADGKWPKKNDTKGERSCQELPA
jgi:DNA-binding NtrC family response regulator